MKADVKAFKKHDTREMCGKLVFTAQSEVDAVQLAALYQHWFLTNAEEGNPVTAMRMEALEAYCKKNNVTVRKVSP